MDETHKALIGTVESLQKQIEQERETNNAATVALQQQKDHLTHTLREAEAEIYQIQQTFAEHTQDIRQHYLKEKRALTAELSTLRTQWAKTLPANVNAK